MKKITLILIIAVTATACSIGDDGPGIGYSYVGILDATLPENFVIDQEYEIDITYDLGSECNTFNNFELDGRQHQEHDSIYEFFLTAVVSYDMGNAANCSDDGIVETKNWTEDFAINSDRYDLIRFNMLSGRNPDGTPEYLVKDVLVIEQEETEEPTE